MTHDLRSESWLELPDDARHELHATCTLGRNKSNDIVLPDGTVSGAHAVLQPTDAGWVILDLRSTNGTYVHGRRISGPVTLEDGAAIRVGPFTLTFRSGSTPLSNGTRAFPFAGTVVQTYNGLCWLLLLDLEGFTARRQALGEPRATALLRAWTTETRSIVERNGGILSSQPGDALLFYWRDDGATGIAAGVDTTLRALLMAQQKASELPFRIILHHGQAQLSVGELRIEQLAGPEVDFLFRIEKLAKPLGTHSIVSERAALGLNLMNETRDLGAHEVRGFVGRFRLRSFGAPLGAPASPVALAAGTRSVLLVTREGATGDGLVRLLQAEPDLAIAGHVTSARNARLFHSTNQPGLTIVDMGAADDAVTLIRDLSAGGARNVLVLADAKELPLAQRAMQAGARGVVLRDEPTNELLLAVRTAAAGSVYLSRRFAAATLRALAGTDDGGRRSGPASLSDRELEIFHLIATGRRNKDIAEALGVSVKTIETHKENMKVKLELRSTQELGTVARKWLDSGPSRPPF